MLELPKRLDHFLKVEIGVLRWTDIKSLSDIFDESSYSQIKIYITREVFYILIHLHEWFAILGNLSKKLIVDFVFWPGCRIRSLLLLLLVIHLPTEKKLFSLVEFVQLKGLPPFIEIKQAISFQIDCIKQISQYYRIRQVFSVACDINMRDQRLKVFKSLFALVSRIILR